MECFNINTNENKKEIINLFEARIEKENDTNEIRNVDLPFSSHWKIKEDAANDNKYDYHKMNSFYFLEDNDERDKKYNQYETNNDNIREEKENINTLLIKGLKNRK